MTNEPDRRRRPRTDFVGCYDQVLSPLKYKAWTAAGERFARQVHTRRTGQQFY